MIYIKRFCLCIVAFLSIVSMIAIVLIMLMTFPVWALTYYVITGDDPLKEEIMEFPQRVTNDFLSWYDDRFGP